MKKKMVILVCVGSLLIYSTQSQVLNQLQFTDHLDSFIKKILEKIPVIPALTITVVNENGPLFNKAYGWANKESGLKADLNTEFYIASSTKSFTALAAALFDHEKKIMLDSPVKKYFGNIKFATDIGSDVTIKNILTHTSGLGNDALTFRLAYSGDIDKNEILTVFSDATIARKKPGSYEYDNLGYNIYGLALQEYLHQQWQDVLQSKIFMPLGMKRTTAYISVAKKNNWTIAAPYSAYGLNGLEKIELEKTDNTMQSAGGIITTPTDIAAWLQAQITNGKLNNKQIFPAQVMQTTHTGVAPFEKGSGIFSAPGQYGLGWFVSQYRDEKVIYHFGGYPGFRSHISFLPDKKIGVAIFVNEGTIGAAAVDLIARFIYDWVKGDNVVEQYRNKIDELESFHKQAIENTQRSFVDKAKRNWQLSLPLQTYTGKYRHPFIGDMNVSIEKNVLSVRMGNLHAVSTPYIEKETIRVELIPGSGRVVSFKIGDDGKVNALSFEGQEYKRVI